jgi:hypothetical protein
MARRDKARLGNSRRGRVLLDSFPVLLCVLVFSLTVRYGRFRVKRKENPLVRVPDFVLNCAGFVGEVAHKDSFGVYGDLIATGFFVSVKCRSAMLVGRAGMFLYFVTARHVAKDLENKEATSS